MTEEELRRAAVERAYRDHAEGVYRVTCAILRDPDDASDAVHETFARAYRAWERYDDQRPLGPWLGRIAARVALDASRRRRVRAIRSLRIDPDSSPGRDRWAGDPSPIVERRRIVVGGRRTTSRHRAERRSARRSRGSRRPTGRPRSSSTTP